MRTLAAGGVGLTVTLASVLKTLPAKHPREGLAKIIQNTMKLTKKKRTWFQRDPAITWIGAKIN